LLGGEVGTESTISCPLLKALDKNGLRSSNGTSENSTGPRDLRASCRTDMTFAGVAACRQDSALEVAEEDNAGSSNSLLAACNTPQVATIAWIREREPHRKGTGYRPARSRRALIEDKHDELTRIDVVVSRH
jgi:hypothetical protein